MAKSLLTIAELRAQGMLLNMFYDELDHTFFRMNDTQSILLDADTMEPVENSPQGTDQRIRAVRAGTLGAKDYGKTQVPDNGQDD